MGTLMALLAGCGDDAATPTGGSGSIAGRVIVSGPLSGATISLDQLDLETGDVARHVGDTVAATDGSFTVDTGTANGLVRITASGGTFTDLATGAVVQLDATDKLQTLATLELLEDRTGLLVSPVGHLIDARTLAEVAGGSSPSDAFAVATDHLDRHFGNVEWQTVVPADLTQPATSPTEPVRAAFIQAALSFLVQDIALEAGASSQESNVFTLTKLWAQDIGEGVFDGNDGNARTFGAGLQLGTCAAVTPCDIPTVGCTTGACRPGCDLYVGTPRAILGGAMTKIIYLDGQAGRPLVNGTKLSIPDILPIARAVSENTDSALFGSECIETLDRTKPTITFDDTPMEGAVVKGAVAFHAVAVDDFDTNLRTTFVGYADEDGDPSNNAALATINTVTLPVDGALTITAMATDTAGNVAMASRTVLTDNTAPAVTIAPTGFFVDGTTWWTGTSGVTLTGTIDDANPGAIKALVNATELVGTVAGTTWSITLPAGLIETTGTDIRVIATDAAGNTGQAMQRLRYDASPPTLTFQASTVNDEAGDLVTFVAGPGSSMDEAPVHQHNGTAINLDTVGGCPTVTKYAYLLDANPPPYGSERDAQNQVHRNPILYALQAADDGVGIAAGTTQYRVGIRAGATTTPLLDWSSAGAGVDIAAGVKRHDVSITTLVPTLATTEGVYDVELRSTDRLQRTTSVSRCFTLKLKAPPMHFGTGGPATGHDRALAALTLAPSAAVYDIIAKRLLNATTETGASLTDQPFINGTASAVYLTVTVTKPTAATATVSFALRNAVRTVTSLGTQGVNCTTNPTACDSPKFGMVRDSGVQSPPVSGLTYPVRVFERDAFGVIIGEVTCSGCVPTDTTFKFTIPPRAVPPAGQATGRPPRYFVAMTMVGQVVALFPQDTMAPSTGPFDDFTEAGIRVTGKIERSFSGCTNGRTVGSTEFCTETTAFHYYRAMTKATLSFASPAASNFKTSATGTLNAETVSPNIMSATAWTVTESTLP